MTKFALQTRAKKFRVNMIKLCEQFPKNAPAFETAKQLTRSAVSIGASYRAACRGIKSRFIYNIEVVLEEADESLYWLEVSQDAVLIPCDEIEKLIRESNELVSIFNAADITAKKNRNGTNLKIAKSQNLK